MLDWNALKSRRFLVLAAFVVCVALTLIYTAPPVTPLAISALTAVAVTYGGIQSADDVVARMRGLVRQGDYHSKKFKVAVGASGLITALAVIGVPPEILESLRLAAPLFIGGVGVVDLMAKKNGG